VVSTPRTLSDYIDAIREAFVCDRCGRYVGSLAPERYLPPLYPITAAGLPEDDEARTLVTFEWHMLGMLRQGKFALRHPERDGVCITARQWAEDEDEDDDDHAHDNSERG